jgi:glycosyltransferase involved in cell wall biosynthesis
MRIFVPRPNEEWICDVIIDEFKSATRNMIAPSGEVSDVVWLFARWIWSSIPSNILSSRPVVSTVHHIVPSKVSRNEFSLVDKFTDIYHVPNAITKQQLHEFTDKPIKQLPYWVNQRRWFVDDTSVMHLPFKKKIIVASFQRDTEGSSVAGNPKPKLEKGPDIFVEIIKSFARSDIEAFVPGWRRDFITKSLDDAGYSFITCGKMPDALMNTQYNMVRRAGGCYLITSRYEGGPQAVLEAALTRTWVLSTPVGIAPEILHSSSICSCVDEFVEKLKRGPEQHIIEQNYNNALKYITHNIVPLYDDMLEDAVHS